MGSLARCRSPPRALSGRAATFCDSALASLRKPDAASRAGLPASRDVAQSPLQLGNSGSEPVAAAADDQQDRVRAGIGRNRRENSIDAEIAVGLQWNQNRIVNRGANHWAAEQSGVH